LECKKSVKYACNRFEWAVREGRRIKPEKMDARKRTGKQNHTMFGGRSPRNSGAILKPLITNEQLRERSGWLASLGKKIPEIHFQ